MKQVELYNHNKTTYENITRIFETSNKCATVQPTGSGKSFLIFKLAQDNSDKTIVVFEPNKQIIGRVSEQMKEYGIDNIKFYTYQKLNSQHKRDEISIDNADYICLDELHRIKAKQWEQAVIAIQDKFPNAKVLGLTATPERMDGQNIIDYFGAELACNITLGDAIVNKILPCPTYISALYTFDEEIQRVFDKINESRNSDEEKNDMRTELEVARKQLENALGVPTILKKHIPDSNGKYIVFCQNVEHLNTMELTIENWFTQAGFDVHMYSVHTKNPNHKAEYNQFQVDDSDCIKLCLCVDMFNEGVHLERISGVILLRPTQSSIIYLQQIGRAISASDENIPIIFDLVNNSNCLCGASFRNEIESALERQRAEVAECEFCDERNKEIFDIGIFHIYDYVKNSLDVFNMIENKCIDNFDYHFQQFLKYKAKYGHGCVLQDEAKEFDGLWNFAKGLRHNKNVSKIKKQIMINNGFIFNVEKWKNEQLIIHINQYLQNNSLPIPSHYICTDGYKLGNRITILKKNAKDNCLSELQRDIITKFNINLEINNNMRNWETFYNLCIEYMQLYPNIPIGQKTIYKNYHIGSWVDKQKNSFKKGLLDSNKISLLNKIPYFTFSKTESDNQNWDNKLLLSKEYLKLSRSNIKYSTVYKGEKLGIWISQQRYKYKQGKLSEKHYHQILSLGIDLAKEGSVM